MATQKLLRMTPLFALCLWLAVVLLLATTAEARGPQQEGDGRLLECQECHTTITHEWENSKHGQSNSLTFQRSWKAEGEPAECLVCHTGGAEGVAGLDCATCHSPVPGNHPDDIMPVPARAESCGDCHTETHAEWEQSVHGQQGMACINCHNPHTSSLKVNNPEALCKDCHIEESHFFGFTAHATEGLTCSDCHLRMTGKTAEQAHSPRLHTFEVDLQSCTQCHGNSMHYPVRSTKTDLDGLQAVDQASLRFPNSERAQSVVGMPAAANPLTYLLAAMAGVGIGFIVAPGVESIYRRFRH